MNLDIVNKSGRMLVPIVLVELAHFKNSKPKEKRKKKKPPQNNEAEISALTHIGSFSQYLLQKDAKHALITMQSL